MANPTFASIPDNILVPGFYVEFSSLNSEIPFDDIEPALMFTPMLSTGTATANIPTRVITADHGRGLTGRGSIGHRMIAAFRDQNPLKELWVIPVADAGGATKALWTFYAPDDAESAGAIYLYIGGQLVQVPVASGDTGIEIITALKAVIEDSPDLVVEYVTDSLLTNSETFTTVHATETFTTGTTHGWAVDTKVRFNANTGTLPTGVVEGTDYYIATVPLSTTFTLKDANDVAVTISADAIGDVTVEAVPTIQVRGKNAGTLLNNLNIQLNYLDSAAGQVLPSGVSLEWEQTTAGATDPTMTTPLAAMMDEPYDYIGTPWLDTLAALDAEMEERWLWNQLLYGHVWAVKRDTSANIITYGDTLNSKNQTVFGVQDYPHPDFEILGAILGQMSLSLDEDPALPEQTLPLRNILAPKRGATGRWDMETRNAILTAGIATLRVERGNGVTIERSRNTYKTDDVGDSDKTFRDIQSRFVPMRSTRYLNRVVRTKFRRKKIVPDGNVLPIDGSTVTPSVIKNEFQAAYGALQEVGWLTNIGLFKERASVVINASDPSRVDVLFPNELVKQVRVLALVNQFQ